MYGLGAGLNLGKVGWGLSGYTVELLLCSDGDSVGFRAILLRR